MSSKLVPCQFQILLLQLLQQQQQQQLFSGPGVRSRHGKRSKCWIDKEFRNRQSREGGRKRLTHTHTHPSLGNVTQNLINFQEHALAIFTHWHTQRDIVPTWLNIEQSQLYGSERGHPDTQTLECVRVCVSANDDDHFTTGWLLSPCRGAR